jgi:hydrogenase-4 component B
MPFHAWLPNAHPAAPAHVSGLLSAINIKAGIYGIARMFMFFPTAPQSFGCALLAVALISAIGGVWYALAQHEIKRLLAYHSVENIGIIGLGLAVAWLGRCVGAPGLVALWLAGALLHTLNHAIFKALLFFGAGNAHLYAHTGDIERLGGLAKALPVTGVGFLIGVVVDLRAAAVQWLCKRVPDLRVSSCGLPYLRKSPTGWGRAREMILSFLG